MSERCYACGQPNRDELIKRLKEQNADLLEACKRTKEILVAWGPERRGHTLELLHERIEAAIAKATGAGQ